MFDLHRNGHDAGIKDTRIMSDWMARASRLKRPRLARHLLIVLVLKIILLTLLWHAFIKPNKVTVDVDTMGNRIAGTAAPPSPTSSIPTSPGDNK